MKSKEIYIVFSLILSLFLAGQCKKNDPPHPLEAYLGVYGCQCIHEEFLGPMYGDPTIDTFPQVIEITPLADDKITSSYRGGEFIQSPDNPNYFNIPMGSYSTIVNIDFFPDQDSLSYYSWSGDVNSPYNKIICGGRK